MISEPGKELILCKALERVLRTHWRQAAQATATVTLASQLYCNQFIPPASAHSKSCGCWKRLWERQVAVKGCSVQGASRRPSVDPEMQLSRPLQLIPRLRCLLAAHCSPASGPLAATKPLMNEANQKITILFSQLHACHCQAFWEDSGSSKTLCREAWFQTVMSVPFNNRSYNHTA